MVDYLLLAIATFAGLAAAAGAVALTFPNPNHKAARWAFRFSALSFGSLGVIWGAAAVGIPMVIRLGAAGITAAIAAIALTYLLSIIVEGHIKSSPNGDTVKPQSSESTSSNPTGASGNSHEEPTGTPRLITPPSSARRNSDGSERIFVSVSPIEMKEVFDKHTMLQAQGLLQPYKGKWMALSGGLNDIHKDNGGGMMVNLGAPGLGAFFNYGMALQLHFDPVWNEKLSVLKKDSIISAVCRIDDIQQIGMAFGGCELIEPA
jgi:hypothetical protein